MRISYARAARYGRTWLATAALANFVCAGAIAESTLHPGDRVAIVVFNHPELSSTSTIDADGSVSLPVAGTVAARGVGTATLAKRIQDRLAYYVKNVSVRVALDAQSNSIFIAGGPSGVLTYQPGETLVSVLDRLQYAPTTRAGRTQTQQRDVSTNTEQVSAAPLDLFDGPVDYTRVSLVRDARSLGSYDIVALRSAGKPGPALLPGDTVELVNKPVAVVVRGEVVQPGIAYIDRGDPLMRAIDQVGGTSPVASQTAITLVRGGVTQSVSLGSPVFMAPATSGDALVVPRAPRIDVLGTVVKPGETYLRGNQTLVSALYYAGGPDRFANLHAVQVIHNGTKTEYDLERLRKGHGGVNPPLQDGDVVFVPQGSTIDAQLIFGAIASLGTLGYLTTR